MFDSSDEEVSLEKEEPLVDHRTKRKKTVVVEASPTKAAQKAPPLPPPPQTDGAYGQPALHWIPGHYVSSQSQQAVVPWTVNPLAPLAGTWPGQAPGQILHCAGIGSQDSEDRFSRQKRKNEYDFGSRQRASSGTKPNCVFVMEGGEVDGGCKGKNAWDKALRDLVPKCLDMSVVSWKKHRPHTLKKLRAALDNKFEYLGNPLSMLGFRTSVMRYMKAERSCLKSHYLKCLQKGTDKAPLHIDGVEWDRLKDYWNTDAQKLKAQKMAKARKSVKNYTLIGRKGKAGREALAVSLFFPDVQ